MDDNGAMETQESSLWWLEKENAHLKKLLADSIESWDKLKKAYDEHRDAHEYCHYHGDSL